MKFCITWKMPKSAVLIRFKTAKKMKLTAHSWLTAITPIGSVNSVTIANTATVALMVAVLSLFIITKISGLLQWKLNEMIPDWDQKRVNLVKDP